MSTADVEQIARRPIDACEGIENLGEVRHAKRVQGAGSGCFVNPGLDAVDLRVESCGKEATTRAPLEPTVAVDPHHIATDWAGLSHSIDPIAACRSGRCRHLDAAAADADDGAAADPTAEGNEAGTSWAAACRGCERHRSRPSDKSAFSKETGSVGLISPWPLGIRVDGLGYVAALQVVPPGVVDHLVQLGPAHHRVE